MLNEVLHLTQCDLTSVTENKPIFQDGKTCRTCKNYSNSYGFRNGRFVGSYISCDFKKEVADKCKQNNFSLYVKDK